MLTKNIDLNTVESFGAEWLAFNKFDSEEIELLGSEYFDIITPQMLNESSTMADFGCGTGRFSKYWQPKVKKIYAIDPSDAVIAAQKLIGEYDNIDIIRASIDDIPLDDNSLDFAMSIGVLHHIPDTQKALTDCVKKVKIGGYFYLYLYYSLDNRGMLFRMLWKLSDLVRFIVCKLPQKVKKVVCEIIAILFYMPFVILTRLVKSLGFPSNVWSLIPLSAYHNKSFFVIRNDALDRFGTPLEHRFSKVEIEKMMQNAGLSNVVFSNKMPFWHAVGQKITKL
jgi:ubiquinone/menaquinone biosynthesis C-methylase UbiE